MNINEEYVKVRYGKAAAARTEAWAFFEWAERVDSQGRLLPSFGATHAIKKGSALLEHAGATAPPRWPVGRSVGWGPSQFGGT